MAGDDRWSSVGLLLPMQGEQGATSLVDVKGHELTSYSVTIDRVQADPFGANDGIAVFGDSHWGIATVSSASADLDISSGDSTVELWVWQGTANTDAVLAAEYAGYGWSIELAELHALWRLHVNGATYVVSAPPVPVGVWTHLAAVRSGNTFRLYTAGVHGDTVTASGAINSSSLKLVIGRRGSVWDRRFFGRMAGFRLTKEARYTYDFTPPTERFATTAETTPSGQARLGLEVLVEALGTARCALRVGVGETGIAAAQVAVSVLPPAYLSGLEGVCYRTDRAAQWGVLVVVGGVDVSNQVIGDIMVDAEEGSARIAEFTLRPASGTVVSPASWTGRSVEIHVGDASGGALHYLSRLFVGIVDTPTLNHAERTVAVRCTDDLQGRCLGMTRAALQALIGGYWSAAVFDAAADGWQAAQDIMSTVPAALDISAEGVLRVTPWQAKTVPDLAIGEDLAGAGSIVPTFADRSGMVNEVVVDFGYRFPCVKTECYTVVYDCVTMLNFAQFLLEDRAFMQRAQIVSALEASGGTVVSITYRALPTWVVPVGSGYFTPSAADLDLCMGFTADVSFSYTATTEEQHTISVRNPASIAALGLRTSALTGSLEGVYPDLVAVESGIVLFQNDISGVPPIDLPSAVVGSTNTVAATLTAETDRAAANGAMETLISVAKTKIAASHRRNVVQVTVPLMPVIDVDKTLGLVADGVQVAGKCKRLVHRLSPDSGAAVSDVSIALSSLLGVGVDHPETATTAPDGTSDEATGLSGLPEVTFDSSSGADHTITVTFPAVSTDERGNKVVPMATTVDAPILEDLFSITL